MSEPNAPERFCLKCLLSELPGRQEQARLVDAQISALPAYNRASEETRARRVAICRECEYLEDATCALCGCYVDWRAAQQMKTCPDLPDRWKGCAELRSN